MVFKLGRAMRSQRSIYHSIYITSRVSNSVLNAVNFLKGFYGSADSTSVRVDSREGLGRVKMRVLTRVSEVFKVAVGVGFEPTEGINPQRFSRPPLSTTQPAHQIFGQMVQRRAHYSDRSAGIKRLGRLLVLKGMNSLFQAWLYQWANSKTNGLGH